jgi:putative membrane protein
MLFIKKLIFFVVVVLLIIIAIAFSGLNTEKVMLNLYYFKFELSLGFLLILSLFLGLLIGLMMALFQFYFPMKSELRKSNRKNRQILAEKRLEAPND